MQFYEYTRDTYRHPICWESSNPDCYPHFHKSIELVYVMEGKILASLNGRNYEAGRGQLLIVPGYTIHSFRMMECTRAWLCTIPQDVIASYKQVLSSNTFSSLVVDLYDNEPKQNVCGIGPDAGGNCLLESFNRIRELSDRKDDLAVSVLMTGYSYLILGELIRRAGIEPLTSPRISEFSQEVLGYLEEHYLDCYDLEEISKHFGYSKSRFSHLFNEIFGCRLVEYMNGLRCAHALSLLLAGRKNITEIALESGFETTRTFYRAFRKFYGAAPGDFVMGNVS